MVSHEECVFKKVECLSEVKGTLTTQLKAQASNL